MRHRTMLFRNHFATDGIRMEEKVVAVFEYTATSENQEGHSETGLVVARDKIDAFDKLRRHQLRLVHLHKVEGWFSFLKGLSANIK